MVNCYYSGGVSNSTLEKRARAIAALATSLHNGGYDIEVLIIMPCRLDGKTYLLECQVQDPTNVYDLDRLAYWMGHPAAIRNIVYGLDGLINGPGMGRSNLSQEILTGIKQRAVAEGWLYVEEAYLNGHSGGSGRCEAMCSTEEGSIEWIKKQMSFVKDMKMAAAEGRPQSTTSQQTKVTYTNMKRIGAFIGATAVLLYVNRVDHDLAGVVVLLLIGYLLFYHLIFKPAVQATTRIVRNTK